MLVWNFIIYVFISLTKRLWKKIRLSDWSVKGNLVKLLIGERKFGEMIDWCETIIQWNYYSTKQKLVEMIFLWHGNSVKWYYSISKSWISQLLREKRSIHCFRKFVSITTRWFSIFNILMRSQFRIVFYQIETNINFYS